MIKKIPCRSEQRVLSQTCRLTLINGLRTFFASFEGDGGGGGRDDAPPIAFFGGVAGVGDGGVGDGGGEENTVERSFSCSGANLGLGLRFFQVLHAKSVAADCHCLGALGLAQIVNPLGLGSFILIYHNRLPHHHRHPHPWPRN